jgi:hypothetical protein
MSSSFKNQLNNIVISVCVLVTYSVALVRRRTIPTERPQLVGEVSANVCGRRCHVVIVTSLRPYSRISRLNLLYTSQIYTPIRN